jgi:hypothetical protein
MGNIYIYIYSLIITFTIVYIFLLNSYFILGVNIGLNIGHNLF